MPYRLTKSKFIRGQQCVKALYLDVYHPELASYPKEVLEKFRRGRDFEYRAKATFPGGIDLSAELGREVDRYPLLTAELLAADGPVTLYEAGFLFGEVLVLADVVRKEADGSVYVYEIKNATQAKEVFRHDVCIQHYVIVNSLQQMAAPLQLADFSLLYHDEEGNILTTSLLLEAREAMDNISRQVAHFLDILQHSEPRIEPAEQCDNPYPCPYKDYCNKQHSKQLELLL